MKINQVENTIMELNSNLELYNKAEMDSYLHKMVNNETIYSVIEKQIIRKKLKQRIGKLGDEHSRIKNIKYEKVHVDGLEEDGSDDLNLDTYYFDVVYKEKSFTFYMQIDKIEVYKNKCGCNKFVCINYDFGYSGVN